MNIEIYEAGKNQLATFLKIASGNIDRFMFHVKENNHLHCRFMDASQVALCTLDLTEDSQLKVIDCEQVFHEKPFSLDVKDFLKMVTYVKNQSILLSSEVSDDGELQGLNCLIQDQEGEIEKEIILPCFINETKQDVPKIKFGENEVNFTIDAQQFKDLITESNEYNSTSLEIETKNGGDIYDMIFTSCDDHNSRKKIKTIKRSNKDFEINDGKICDSKVMYSLENVTKLVNVTPAYNKINIRFAEKQPIIITYVSEIKEEEALFRTANLDCYLAPKIVD